MRFHERTGAPGGLASRAMRAAGNHNLGGRGARGRGVSSQHSDKGFRVGNHEVCAHEQDLWKQITTQHGAAQRGAAQNLPYCRTAQHGAAQYCTQNKAVLPYRTKTHSSCAVQRSVLYSTVLCVSASLRCIAQHSAAPHGTAQYGGVNSTQSKSITVQ